MPCKARKARTRPARAPRPNSTRLVLARCRDVASTKAVATPPAVALPVSDNTSHGIVSRPRGCSRCRGATLSAPASRTRNPSTSRLTRGPAVERVRRHCDRAVRSPRVMLFRLCDRPALGRVAIACVAERSSAGLRPGLCLVANAIARREVAGNESDPADRQPDGRDWAIEIVRWARTALPLRMEAVASYRSAASLLARRSRHVRRSRARSSNSSPNESVRRPDRPLVDLGSRKGAGRAIPAMSFRDAASGWRCVTDLLTGGILYVDGGPGAFHGVLRVRARRSDGVRRGAR